MCSLHLTHPSAHTWSSGQPTVQRPGSSRGLPAGAGMLSHEHVAGITRSTTAKAKEEVAHLRSIISVTVANKYQIII